MPAEVPNATTLEAIKDVREGKTMGSLDGEKEDYIPLVDAIIEIMNREKNESI